MARLATIPRDEESIAETNKPSNGFSSMMDPAPRSGSQDGKNRQGPSWLRQDQYYCQLCGSKRATGSQKSSGSSSRSRSRSRSSSRSQDLYQETCLCGCPAQQKRSKSQRKKGTSRASTDPAESELQVTMATLDPSQPKPVHKMSRRNIKAHVKRFKTETKAAKTVGVIVGGFILCWLPFFTMYVIRAFCPHCIPPLLFSVLFWLGYCNSAINPCIYALFSKDFRFAFQKILCKCLCTKKSHGHHSQIKPPQLILFSEDSDNANEPSDST